MILIFFFTMTESVYPIYFFLLKIWRQKFSADYLLAQMVLFLIFQIDTSGSQSIISRASFLLSGQSSCIHCFSTLDITLEI